MTGRSLLLVPTERHVEAELAQRERNREADADAPDEVRSRWGFIAGMLAALAPDVAIASPHATRLAVRIALDELPPGRLRQPAEPAARVALAHTLDRALGSLRRAGTSPAELRGLGAFASAVADVLERSDALLRRARRVDPRGAGFLLARALRDAAPGEAPLPAEVTVRGIAAWEQEDLAWVEALHAAIRATGGRGVTVELPALGASRDSVSAFASRRGPEGDAMEPVADALERRWASLTDAPEIAWAPAGAGAWGPGAAAVGHAAPAAAIAARTPEGEARAVAAEVVAALSRGVPPERIAIVVPSLEDAALEPLRAALGDAGVRFSEPRGRAAASCPDGRAALALVRLALGPVSREQAIEILRAPGVHSGAWTERSSAREAARRATSLAHRLREVPVEIDRTGRLLVEGLTTAIAARRADRRPRVAAAAASAAAARRPPAEDDEAWMPHALERLLASGRWLGDGGTRPELARRLLSLFDQLKLGAPSAEELGSTLRAELRGGRGAERAGGALALDAIGQGGRAVRAIREQVEEIAQAARDLGAAARPCTPAEIGAEIERAAAETGVRPRGDASRAGAVRIDLPTGLAGLTHDLVVITGLDARAYAGSAGPEEALLGESLRARLPAPSRPASARERQAWQRAELAWTAAGARRIAVSYTQGDDAEQNDPHPLYRWAARMVDERREPASRVAPGASRLDPRAAELIATASGAPPSPDIAERARIERARAAFFLDPRAPSDPYTGRVDLEGDLALRIQLQAAVGGAMPDQPIAVTHIERAAGCAFAGFARRVLRVRRVEDLLESADARERGTLIHRALQASFEALRELGPEVDPADQLAAARAAAEDALHAGAPMTPLRREAIDKAIADVLQVVVRTIDGGDPVRFLLAERRFGAGEPPPWGPLELAAEGDFGPTIHVDGQIDRIDRSADGRVARVIDYKSGKPDRKDRDRALQLPLYAAVAARALGAEEVRALYVAVRQRGLIELSPEHEEAQRRLAEAWPEAARTARRVVGALWDGRVAPRPAREAICERCDARDVCRRPAVIPAEQPPAESRP